MAIDLIDPNDINVPTIDGKAFDGTNDLENGLPPYEKMFIFAELRVSRRGNTEIIAGSDGLISVGQTANDINISLMGYGEYTDENGKTQKYYSTRYTDNVGGSINKSYLEGIGITNINMKINSSYVPQVTIDMVDTKGLSYVNVGSTQTSPYSIIDSMPPPLYELTLKGYYGQAITYQLHLVTSSKTLESNGNYTIKLELIGMHFAPLSDVLVQHAKTAPFMKFCETYNNGVVQDINYDGKAPVKNFFELCMRAKMLTVKLAQYKNSTTDDENVGSFSEQNNIINTFLTSLRDFNNAETTHPLLGGVGLDGGSHFSVQTKVNINNVDTDGQFALCIDKTDSFTGGTFNYKSTLPILNIILNNIKKEVKTINGITDKDFNEIKPGFILTANEKTYYGINCISLIKKLNQLKDKNANEANGLDEKIKGNVNKITYDALGFYPYIGNVFKIICDDVDKFYKTLKKAGNDANKIYTEKPEVKSVFGIDNSSRKTNTSPLHPWPDYFKSDKPIGKRPTSETRGWLGELAKTKNIILAEVDYVEDFIKNFLTIQSAQKEIDELIVNSTDSNGNSKFFPINPYDSSFYGLTVGEYTNSHNLYAILTTILKRFTVSSQYTYNQTFYNSSVGLGAVKSFFQNIISNVTGKGGADNDRYFLAKTSAKMEAVNLTNVFFNNNALADCINFFKTVTDLNSFVAQLDKLSSTSGAEGLSKFYKTGSLSDYADPNVINGDVTKLTENGHDLYIDFKNDNFQRFDLKKVIPLGDSERKPGGDEQKLVDDLLGNQNTALDNGSVEFSKDNLFYQRDKEYDVKPPDGKIYSDFFLNSKSHPTNVYQIFSNYDIVKKISSNPKIKNPDGTINVDEAFYAMTAINVSGLLEGILNTTITKQFKDDDQFIMPDTFVPSGLSKLLSPIDDKFRLPGIIEAPYVFILSVGNKIKLNRNNNFDLSKKDTQLFLDEYEKNINSYDFKGYFDAINAITKKDDQEDPKKVIKPFLDIFITSDLNGIGKLSFTEKLILVNNTTITVDTKQPKYRTPIDVLKDDKLKDGNTAFFDTLLYELKTRLTEKLRKKNEETKQTNSKLNDNDLKNDIYYMFKSINDKWLTDTPLRKGYDDSFGYPNFSSLNVTTLFERFKFVDRAYNDISGTNEVLPGNGCVIDISALADFIDNTDASIFTLISRLLADNGFNFFPLQSYIDYNAGNSWFDSFRITESVAPANNGPTFVCMYVGGNSSKGAGDEYSEHKDDGFQINTIDAQPNDYSTGNVKAFKVSFGKQNQSIFKTLTTSTNEFRETHESLNILSKIAGDGNKSVPPPKGQSLFNIQEQRSYTTNVTMLGCMNIQPTLYYQLEHVPIFRGAYMILDVEHNITPNYMSTKFEGVRLLKFPVPFVTDYATNVGFVDGSSTDVSLSPSGSLLNSNNSPDIIPTGIGVGTIKDDSKYQITNEFIELVKNVKFKNSTDINKFIKGLQSSGNKQFVQLFNSTVAGRGAFGVNVVNGKKFEAIGGINEVNFNKFWDNLNIVFKKPTINVFEFIALNTIISNETGGKYEPLTEGLGLPGHQGIGYAFDEIAGIKKSYNIPSNILAFDLFNNSDYISAHGGLKYGNILKNTQDQRWKGKQFPYGFSKDTSGSETSSDNTFVSEADFVKFRGRGYIQTTFRGAYLPLIKYVLNYTGTDNNAITQYQKLWSKAPFNGNVNTIATRSTNADWNFLFSDTGGKLAYSALNIYSNNAGGLFNIPDAQMVKDNSDALKSYIKRYAVTIAGGGAGNYHKLYMNRVFQTLSTLGNNSN